MCIKRNPLIHLTNFFLQSLLRLILKSLLFAGLQILWTMWWQKYSIMAVQAPHALHALPPFWLIGIHHRQAGTDNVGHLLNCFSLPSTFFLAPTGRLAPCEDLGPNFKVVATRRSVATSFARKFAKNRQKIYLLSNRKLEQLHIIRMIFYILWHFKAFEKKQLKQLFLQYSLWDCSPI